ncbi:SDR family NAD(P)-dependent oxidoreductase [Mycobacterium sp. CBMA293]|uniref:SDR family NAD(P)-dependent oxidoreductase n=1 Tax=unclassified Mycolicibacterium TaxID=2636767 RepID=UPI0012DE6502|nr:MULTISPECIES: SDR family NAD(P)-dependent oxidoreductase [unclassified Mycolicibacterium]MUL47032.1 SDR family NAD(P)-dependent oxidoreductase [Mycolicibacterium sp. CBMA 360]MUL58408.1 SDR family NAD(P)-dependent oxidoreductase [Mycolicibacterium sp. CBMA 335]MUL73866.1 SDR family NAD(P)-dependent oxidoreductase [Mycolicibacterium sp. CBMA 311]MUL93291.1 SDR family NAD(P)-dependent oxidoreductase [Mycolicibacterium sp. CBMA 230]MUM07838.1 oxidoreductase [Mycolicibacterium sp. CBMA 213]
MGAQELFGGGIAVITGAGSGIGAGLARYAAKLGMTTVLADVNADAVAALRDELTATGATAIDAVCDVRDGEAVQALADRVTSDIGPVRLLVNNAGIEQFGYLWDTPVANWERVMDINVSGVFHGVRAFLPAMMATAESAWVWNMSSVGGVSTVQLQAPYIVSKHAVLALTECLRVEVELAGHDEHICVQAVLPGPVQSNIFTAAGGVESGTGDGASEASESERTAMHQITAMDPLTAAETIFDQSAAGGFYLTTHPDAIAGAMTERARVLSEQAIPKLRNRRFATQ